MNILVTGANGQLGNEMRALSAENGQHTYFFTDVQELDICDEQAIRAFVSANRVDVIVNCAAYTAVDKAEDNPELCDKLNHIAPGYLAAAAEACGAAMIQVSTDYVFDGTGHIPYTECEVRLRTYYLRWLIEKASECVHGKSKKALLDQINVQTDVINLINAYRMKKYFYADAQILKKYMLPFYGRLSKEKQFVLFETQSPEDYLRMLARTSYGRKMETLTETMPSEQFERELVRIRCTLAKRSLMFSEDAAVSLYSLMYLSEVELNNIINIIEGIRYNKSVSYMENLIVLQ